ncbi:MAG: hypothetical protein CL610_12365 [Anaerolineaceae bacterium]|nr:hypothetical protein [Anaerolineaceae bacterium]
MIYDSLRRYTAFVSQIGIDPTDTDEIRLQKTLLIAFTLAAMVAGVLWSALYLVFNEPVAATIPFGFTLLSTISLLLFAWQGNYNLFRFIQLGAILLLPFLLMVSLGGFVNASAVIVWSFLCPMGAIVFCKPHQARMWLIAYIVLLVISAFLEGIVRQSNNLPSPLIVLFFVMNIGAISIIVLSLMAYFIREKNAAFALLQTEQERSENLLLNVLPGEIATILKRQPGIIADQFDEASILFADLVGFTPLSTRMTPVETVELLNEIFSYFDSLVTKYNLEKIRTIGDNYMVAAGVPRPRPDHCQAIARLALDMRAYLNDLPLYAGQKVQFRIGINAGPLVGGVIGHHKFHYDVWGDTVNTASRMESHGVPQEIQITTTVYHMLREEFHCEARGYIEVKGKGRMSVWLLTGEKQPAPTQ